MAASKEGLTGVSRLRVWQLGAVGFFMCFLPAFFFFGLGCVDAPPLANHLKR